MSKQFSLRTIFFAITAIAILTEATLLLTRDYRERRALRNELIAMGASYAFVRADRSKGVMFVGPVPADVAKYKVFESIELSNMTLDRPSCSHLASIEQVELLMLQSCKIDDPAELAPLCEIGAVHNLCIWNSPIDDESIDWITKMRGLRLLDLKSTKITPTGIDRLRAELPGVVIHARP